MPNKLKHNYVGLITVRTSSSRLPQKALLPIGNRKLVEHVIDRAKVSLKHGLSNVVVCTSTEPADDILESIAKENDVDFFRGSLADKIDRWRAAAEQFGADYIITIDGDDPFCDPELVAAAIKQLEKKPVDVITADGHGFICGAFTHAISTKTLQKICEVKDSTDTEMTKPYLLDSGMFKVELLDVGPEFKDSSVRLTLDYPEDLEFFRAVFSEMNMKSNTVPLRDIMLFLKSRPDIIALNISRQGDFVANQKKSSTLKLKKDGKK